MNQHKEVQNKIRKNNLQIISLAFRKVFDGVAIRMHSVNNKSHHQTGSGSNVQTEPLLIKRKYSLSLSDQRRSSNIFDINTRESRNRFTNLEFASIERRKKQEKLSLRQYALKSLRSNQDGLIERDLLQYNKLLVTRSCLFKTVVDKGFKKETKQKNRCCLKIQQNVFSNTSTHYQSKIRKSKIKRNQNRGKALYLQGMKDNEVQPWQTEGVQQYYFNNH